MTNNAWLGQVGDYEIKLLRIFTTVADCGGFTAAETVLNISRSTISVHISKLESRLGLTLCKRGRGGFSLTREGAVVYQEAAQLFDQIERFRGSVNNLGALPVGRLTLALSDTFSLDSRIDLPGILGEFGRLAPDVELDISVDQMTSMEQQVLNEEVDIAFIPYHRRLEGLRYLHLFSETCYLYCSHTHPLAGQTADELSDETLRAHKLVHAGLKPHDAVYRQIAGLNPQAVAYHYESRVAMVLSGLYITFLPEFIARPYQEQGLLIALSPATRRFRLGAAAIVKKTAQPSRARETFLQVLRSRHPGENNHPPY
ncbi:LysR family transcriptional regulator [Granulosicoccaceae sp. 1_MG-2023]|nr:LysR family transcriptional regulator [Granulosicoccaceae sp. 1_MG-2023]